MQHGDTWIADQAGTARLVRACAGTSVTRCRSSDFKHAANAARTDEPLFKKDVAKRVPATGNSGASRRAPFGENAKTHESCQFLYARRDAESSGIFIRVQTKDMAVALYGGSGLFNCAPPAQGARNARSMSFAMRSGGVL